MTGSQHVSLLNRARSSRLRMTGSPSANGEADAAAAAGGKEAIKSKLHWHIMSRFCALTVLNHMDRANLAYASVQLNADLGFSASVYGIGSGVFFVSYMAFQIPAQLVAERVGLPRWIGGLLIGWGAVAVSFAGLTSNVYHFYALRFLLGAFEAGAFPAMWAHLTRFYAGGPDLADAWGCIAAAQPVAQVVGAPIAASLLLADGFLGLRGWQWMFLAEGLPSVLLGVWIWATLAGTPADADFLSAAERETVALRVSDNKEQMARDTGEQGSMYALRSWKVWAQGFGSGWIGITRYGAMYWTPLIVYSIIGGDPKGAHDAKTGALAVLLTGIPFSWSAIVTILNSRHAKRTGEMYWHCIGPMIVGTAALALLAAALGRNPWLAFLGVLLAASSQASNPLEWAYPATYLHGVALSTGWAAANCLSGYGGVVGPALIGWLKDSSGGYSAPMLVLTAVAALAVAYFAVLLRLLPVKRSSSPTVSDDEESRLMSPLPAELEMQRSCSIGRLDGYPSSAEHSGSEREGKRHSRLPPGIIASLRRARSTDSRHSMDSPQQH